MIPNPDRPLVSYWLNFDNSYIQLSDLIGPEGIETKPMLVQTIKLPIEYRFLQPYPMHLFETCCLLIF